MLKIATWNVNSVNARLSNVINWLVNNSIDVLLLQEIKCQNDCFPYEEFEKYGYKLLVNGQKSYNGVAIVYNNNCKLKSYSITYPDNTHDEEARYIEAIYNTILGDLKIISIYVPNGTNVGHEKYYRKVQFLENLCIHLKKLSNDFKVLVGGDFNVAPFDIDVHDSSVCTNHLAFSQLEKECLRKIINCGYLDCYRTLNPDIRQYTWWDYRHQGLQKNHGWRIDGILVNPSLVDYLCNSYVDKNERYKDKPSDHVPVVAEFNSFDNRKYF